MLNVSSQRPPNWLRLEKEFDLKWLSEVAVTFGDTCYTAKGGLPLDLRAHEEVHVLQQKLWGTEEWWEKYITEPSFRKSQELAGIKAQIEYIKANVPNRKKRDAKLTHILNNLAMYGDVTMEDEIKKLIHATN